MTDKLAHERWRRSKGIMPREEWLKSVRKPGWCIDCKRQLPLEMFSRCNSRPNGTLNVCKPCHSIRQKKWRQSLSPERKEKLRVANSAATKRYRSRPQHKKKVAIHQIVYHAIVAGLLTKQPCEKCGERRVDAHHDDYSRPLDVRWLCRKCHSLHHANAPS